MAERKNHVVGRLYEPETQYCVLTQKDFNHVLFYLHHTMKPPGSGKDNSRERELSLKIQTYAFPSGQRAVPVKVLENILANALDRAERRVVPHEEEAAVIKILRRGDHPTTSGDIIEVNRLTDLIGPPGEAADEDGGPDLADAA
jgi:hypothetical protein